MPSLIEFIFILLKMDKVLRQRMALIPVGKWSADRGMKGMWDFIPDASPQVDGTANRQPGRIHASHAVGSLCPGTSSPIRHSFLINENPSPEACPFSGGTSGGPTTTDWPGRTNPSQGGRRPCYH